MRRASFLVVGVVALTLLACATGKQGPDDARHFDAGLPADARVISDAAVASDATSIDALVKPTGHDVHGTVPGGVKASSPNYRLLGTAGSGDGTASSPNYRYRGGVVGASAE